MSKLKYSLLGSLIMFLIPNLYLAQTQGIAYTAVGKGVATTFLTDYHSLGINSSALGWGTGFEGKKFVFGATEFSAGISSPTLDKTRLRNAFNGIKDQIKGKDSFSFADQRAAVADYAEAGITVNVNYNWFGAAFQGKLLGGLAISVNEDINWFSQLNRQTTDLVFRGKFSNYYDSLVVVYQGDTSTIANSENISQDTMASVIRGERNNPLLISQITNGSRVKFTWNRYFNIGYGRKVFGNRETFAIYAGVGARYIQSVAMFDMQSNSTGISVSSAVSPTFGIQYDHQTNSVSTSTLPEIVGKGYGLDFSASAILLKRIKVALAVNNVGKVSYKRNVFEFNDTLLGAMSIDGIANVNFQDVLEKLSSQNGLLNLHREEEFDVVNAANIRLGGSISFLKDRVNIGVDFVAPFDRTNPSGLQNAVVSFGGDIRPIKWLQLSIGYFGGGIYENNMPIGVNFILGDGRYEFGISSRDALSFFSKDGNSLSSAFGVARFRF